MLFGGMFVLVCVLLALLARASEGRLLTGTDALLLGVIEGITEFLPISSTGHLLVAGRLLGLDDPSAEAALDSFTIVIQGGAIAAVGVLYRGRFALMATGLRRNGREGRQLTVNLMIGFAPAAAVGLVVGDRIKESLFSAGPVAVAWVVGGSVMLVAARKSWSRPAGRTLAGMRSVDALVIGCAQVIALWPGVSRSLVTILAGIAMGLSLVAAVEYSFLLGAIVLTAAAGFEVVANGGTLSEGIGQSTVAIGVVAAFITAVVAIRWLVSSLDHGMLRRFGWYRVCVGALVLLLLAAGLW